LSKSKKSRQPILRQRPTWLAPAVVFGAILVVVALVAIITGTRREPFEPEVTGAPRAEFDQTAIDHGSLRFEQPLESVFRVRNVGDEPLVIQGEPRVELVEGCCPPRAVVSSMTIMPGDEATVTLSYTMHEGMGGQHEFRVHVLTNDPTQPEIPLTIRSFWDA
jgi:hypothetical protein